MKYDVLIVGSGLTAAMLAYKHRDKRVLILERKPYVGGFCRTERIKGIDVHLFGSHIFHTNRRDIWDWVNSITPFRPFNLNIKAIYKGKVYSLPFNMNTFYQLWGVVTPQEAEIALQSRKKELIDTLVRGYTEKQWGRPLEEVSPDIINRLPTRLTWDNNYFYDTYVGIPENGYTDFLERLMANAEVRTDVDYISNKAVYEVMADKVYYTGAIDEYYGYCFGRLDYRCVSHTHELLDTDNYQGCPIMNYTERAVPYTRIVEHKWFKPHQKTDITIISKEYPSGEGEAAYPVNDERNTLLYNKYKDIPNKKVQFCGRLGEYKYYNMNDIIEKYL